MIQSGRHPLTPRTATRFRVSGRDSILFLYLGNIFFSVINRLCPRMKIYYITLEEVPTAADDTFLSACRH